MPEIKEQTIRNGCQRILEKPGCGEIFQQRQGTDNDDVCYAEADLPHSIARFDQQRRQQGDDEEYTDDPYIPIRKKRKVFHKILLK